MDRADNLFVVGAGFSCSAGLPLASNFTKALLDPPTPLQTGQANAVLVAAIRRFVDDAFGGGRELSPDEWPPLEDVFTMIDLAANSGHHLGPFYSAAMLRTMRRALIVRFMRMLRIAYNEQSKRRGEAWETLQQLLREINLRNTVFLSLNWDTVIESSITTTQRVTHVDYGCDAIPVQFGENGEVLHRLMRLKDNSLRVLKPHGSVNWMYCDCCRRMFWFPPKDTPRIASRLFKQSDSDRIKELIGQRTPAIKTKALCPACKAEALGTRMATFSYRKALDFPMHAATWAEAERQLRGARRWIFIGYSLPAADYEFKFLLKRVQLARPRAPEIALVTRGGPTSETAANYTKFFGADAVEVLSVDGLNKSALEKLQAFGSLKARASS